MTDRVAKAAESPELALIERAWAALRAGEFDVVEGTFAPDARWRGVDDGAGICENRREILSVMRRARAAAASAAVEQAIQCGDRVLVAFRPDRPPPHGRPLRRRYRLGGGDRARRPDGRAQGLRRQGARAGLRGRVLTARLHSA